MVELSAAKKCQRHRLGLHCAILYSELALPLCMSSRSTFREVVNSSNFAQEDFTCEVGDRRAKLFDGNTLLCCTVV